MKFLLTSIGSTSWAITTRRAFLFSTNAVTWLMPYFTLMGFFPGASCLPSAFFSAFAVRRAFFSAFVSGRILCNNLNNCVAVRKSFTHEHFDTNMTLHMNSAKWHLVYPWTENHVLLAKAIHAHNLGKTLVFFYIAFFTQHIVMLFFENQINCNFGPEQWMPILVVANFYHTC